MDMEALKKKDPEFYAFLKQNDSKLLDFEEGLDELPVRHPFSHSRARGKRRERGYGYEDVDRCGKPNGKGRPVGEWRAIQYEMVYDRVKWRRVSIMPQHIAWMQASPVPHRHRARCVAHGNQPLPRTSTNRTTTNRGAYHISIALLSLTRVTSWCHFTFQDDAKL